MKLLVFTLCLLAVALSAPTPTPEEHRRRLPALEHNEVRDSKGQYDLSYRTAEGIEVHERGRLVTSDDGKTKTLEVEGETRYIGDDGKIYVTKYRAGRDGSHVEGAHLPVSVVAAPAPVA